jgi:transaldolase
MAEIALPMSFGSSNSRSLSSSPPALQSATSLRLMLDSADVRQWEQWLPMGLFYGVTTNPMLLERSQVPCRTNTLRAITAIALRLGAQEIQLQAWGGTAEAYFETGMTLASFDSRVVVKIPVVEAGVTAAVRLIQQGCRITLTGIYAVPQVLIAAAVGAEYAAPYLGRIHDTGRSGLNEVGAMQRSLNGIDSPTRLLVASIRRLEDVSTLTAQGLSTFTLSSAVMEQFFDVAATIEATAAFEQAASALVPRP